MSPAILSADRRYRFELRRLVDATGYGEVAWIMLNPSTADESTNDPTIRRIIDFSRRWGFRDLRVVNLVPLRSPNPATVVRHYGGPPFEGEFFLNHGYIERAVNEADTVILAWGYHGERIGGDNIREDCCANHDDVWVLGWNGNGQPKHPLYVKAITRPVHAEDESRRWLRS